MTSEKPFEVSVTRSTLDIARQAVHYVAMRTELVEERSRCVAAMTELEALILEVDAGLFEP